MASSLPGGSGGTVKEPVPLLRAESRGRNPQRNGGAYRESPGLSPAFGFVEVGLKGSTQGSLDLQEGQRGRAPETDDFMAAGEQGGGPGLPLCEGSCLSPGHLGSTERLGPSRSPRFQTMMPESEVMPWCLRHQVSKLLVQEKIPTRTDGRVPLAKLQAVVVPEGDEHPGPNPWGGLLDPPIGEGRDGCRVPHPESLARGSGWTLVGQEGDQTLTFQVSMDGPNGGEVVHHSQAVKVADPSKKPSTRGMGWRLGDAEGARSQDGKDRGEPFPLAMVHGKKEGRAGSRPVRIPPRVQGGSIQAVPSIRQESKDFQQGRLEESTIQVVRGLDSHGLQLIPWKGRSRQEGKEKMHEGAKEAGLESSIQPGSSVGDRDGQILVRLVA